MSYYKDGPVKSEIVEAMLKASSGFDTGDINHSYGNYMPTMSGNVLHTAALTARRYHRSQDANANVMAVFDNDPSLAMEQNTEHWHPMEKPDGLEGTYPIQHMFSSMPSRPSGFLPEQFKSVLDAMGGTHPLNRKTKNYPGQLQPSEEEEEEDSSEDSDDDDDASDSKRMFKYLGKVGFSQQFENKVVVSNSLLDFALYRANDGEISSDEEVRMVLEA